MSYKAMLDLNVSVHFDLLPECPYSGHMAHRYTPSISKPFAHHACSSWNALPISPRFLLIQGMGGCPLTTVRCVARGDCAFVHVWKQWLWLNDSTRLEVTFHYFIENNGHHHFHFIDRKTNWGKVAGLSKIKDLNREDLTPHAWLLCTIIPRTCTKHPMGARFSARWPCMLDTEVASMCSALLLVSICRYLPCLCPLPLPLPGIVLLEFRTQSGDLPLSLLNIIFWSYPKAPAYWESLGFWHCWSLFLLWFLACLPTSLSTGPLQLHPSHQ